MECASWSGMCVPVGQVSIGLTQPDVCLTVGQMSTGLIQPGVWVPPCQLVMCVNVCASQVSLCSLEYHPARGVCTSGSGSHMLDPARCACQLVKFACHPARCVYQPGVCECVPVGQVSAGLVHPARCVPVGQVSAGLVHPARCM